MKALAMKSLVGAAVIAAASATQAAQIIQEEDFGSLTTPKTFASFSEFLTFNKFDTSLGTLNSVRVEMDLDVSGGKLAADNDGGNPATIEAELGAEGDVNSGDVVLINNAFQAILENPVVASTSQTLNLAADDGDGEVGGTSNFSAAGADYGFFDGLAKSGTSGDFVAAFGLDSYKGVGTFDIEAVVAGLNEVSGTAVQGQFDPVAAAGKVRIIYDYTAVTSPGTLPLMGLGLMGLLAARRKVNA